VTPGAIVEAMAAAGEVATDMAGAAEPPSKLRVGDTVVVGTGAIELIPRLPISVDPSGIPARAAPPGTVDEVEVGVEEAATLLEPDPHIPDIPEVSSTPEGVDVPELIDNPVVAEGFIDKLCEAAVLPADMPVAGMELPGVIPPPSKLAEEPNMPPEEVPNVEHGMLPPTIAMVPVGLIGAGLTPADVISVAPNGIPVPPTEEPLVASRGEVVLTDGVGTTIICATAAWPLRIMARNAAIKETFTDVLRLERD